MTEKKLVDVLRRYYLEAGSLRKAAPRWGISGQYLYDILKGRRGIGDGLLAKMGYRREVRIVKTLHPL